MTNSKQTLFMRRIESIVGLEQDSGEVVITFEDGSYIKQYHELDCCETVEVAQVDGTVAKHVGATAISLEEKILQKSDMDIADLPEYTDSLTATFYTLKTSKGYLDWRWDGVSNGYYSESVECIFKHK
jgi:hypothetical protein